MSQNEYDAAIAAFIRSKGVTRCPTVCAVPTQGAVSAADQRALDERAAALEEGRRDRREQRRRRLFGDGPVTLSAPV